MKRFSLREFALLLAPIALIALVGVISYVRQQRSLTSKISLTLGRDATPSMYSANNSLGLAWKAKASREWEGYYRVGYDERIVGVGPQGEQTLYTNTSATKNKAWSVSSATPLSGSGPLEFGSTLQAPLESIPVGVKRLEWRGVVVAMVNQGENLIEPVEKASLSHWLQIPGAVIVRKTIPLQVPAGALEPIQECKLEKVSPSNALEGADTCIVTRWRANQHKFYRRLVAFDGKTARIVPIEFNSDDSHYVNQDQGDIGALWYSHLQLKLRDVPTAWGTLTYIFDVVYAPSSTGTHGDACDAAIIAKLKKQGWLHYSQRLTVRGQGQTIQAVIYPKTPNSQLLGIKDWLSPTKWIIEARLRYVGYQKKPGLDLPNGPELFDAKGNYINQDGESFIIQPSSAPGEWVAHIELPRANLKGLPKNEALTMKLEVADTQATPLIIRRQLPIPAGA